MNKQYTFAVKTDDDYYSKLLKIKRNPTIGRVWVVWTLGILVSIMALFLLLVFLLLGKVFPSISVYFGVLLIGYYLYKAIKGNRELKKEYIENLSKPPIAFVATISGDQFLIKENGHDAATGWNDYYGFEQSSQGVIIGFSDDKLLFLDNSNLPNDKKSFLDLLKSKKLNS